MHPSFVTGADASHAIPIWFVTATNWAEVGAQLGASARDFADAAGFEPKPGRHLLLPGADGVLGALFGIDAADAPAGDVFLPGRLPDLLPKGIYRFANAPHDARLAALAFALGTYRFDRYRKVEHREVRLALVNSMDGEDISRIAEGVTLTRDLINTPANDMGPAELEQAARGMAARHGAKVQAIVGDDLLGADFPLVHAVGRAAAQAPRLIDMTWGDPAHPKVTLVGKGVCFDSGGLDIKPSSSMLNMKKDMGGAATVLALAHMVMDRKLKVWLRVLIPAVENSVAGSAFRPRDVYRSRKGITVEIGNTDAEGRLVLADVLALGDAEAPDLLVDMGTLTGAARVALGPELPAFYTNDETWAAEVARYARAENDPVWRMPLWAPYQGMLDSKVADTNNVSINSFAGSITCALFLQRFVESAKVWLHFDIFAWNASSKPGRPEGGECQVARGLYALLKDRYG
ncbi:MAG: leucyl aminopeptidase family protein [Rhizobiales bacterium]|nr:leucyl aminopeptidase family protein [Hyphomicrobiales bacterium]